MKNKIYIAGKITGFPGAKEKFAAAEKKFLDAGDLVMNPAILPPGFEQREYLKICFAMIGVCDAIYFLNNWKDSPGAREEYLFAQRANKFMRFESEEAEDQNGR